jgi:hypothetical protein
MDFQKDMDLSFSKTRPIWTQPFLHSKLSRLTIEWFIGKRKFLRQRRLNRVLQSILHRGSIPGIKHRPRDRHLGVDIRLRE